MCNLDVHLPGISLGGEVWIDRQRMRFGFSRSGGPGGQNVNKVNTKTELRIHPDDLHGFSVRARLRFSQLVANRLDSEGFILIVSSSQRTQEANRRAAVEKLRSLVAAALVEPKIRRKTKPSRASRRRRVESKMAHSRIKQNRRAVKMGE
ncbi:MAG TPA: alternative ribosome rescue aminoacyl-tRNA hydrolase ArfB [Phycisphaerae bacterium]|nr:alternative ribosome rescue aminoacyl-tRNA hydrolase ArfB [Phycisphaerae bacterium]